MSKLKKGQIVFLIYDQKEDAVCEYCGSHYRKFVRSKPETFKITLISFDKFIKEEYGEPLYHLQCMPRTEEDSYMAAMSTSKFAENIYETEEECLVAITKDNS